MAGQKASRVAPDPSKKRKRDVSDANSRTKRSRSEEKTRAKDKKSDRKDSGTNGTDLHSTDLIAQNTITTPLEVSYAAQAGWKMSKSMGGRMMDIDPILTDDEQHLIIAYNTSIQVYSAADSLLIRRIPISHPEAATAQKAATPAAQIVATRLSRSKPSFLWVACTNGCIYHVDWTQNKSPPPAWQTSSKTAHALTVAPLHSVKNEEEVVLVVEADKAGKLDVMAYQLSPEVQPRSKPLLSLKKQGDGLRMLESTDNGKEVVGALNDRLFVGYLVDKVDRFDDLRYEFYSFDVPDLITSLDARSHTRTVSLSKSKSKAAPPTLPVVDVVVGGARGSIFRYHDVLAKLQVLGGGKSSKDIIQAQTYHWHRRAVHAVKWSRDGNYMISGGSENVLVLWQMDTSKRDYLPHLAGCIENISVSRKGSSYAVHLDDNSVMVLSTAELKPITYISGIQSATSADITDKDALVQRVWSAPKHIRQPVPAAIRPSDPGKLHVCVGNGRQATFAGGFSTPLLQSFDLEAFSSTARQALTRTQPTNVNVNSKGHPIDDPQVTHIAFSADGAWLASVDEWDVGSEDADAGGRDGHLSGLFPDDRCETHLKFWEMQAKDGSCALVSRVNSPHAVGKGPSVLDLASSPSNTCFATIGSDGLIRLWQTRARSHHNAASRNGSKSSSTTWFCSRIIPIGDGHADEEASTDMVAADGTPTKSQQLQGKITFSEDGSTLFAAFGSTGAGSVYVIDAASGQTAHIINDLWNGGVKAIGALSSFLVVLSDELRVYDVVSDELRYGVSLSKMAGPADLLQLAVDRVSGHFAVTLPTAHGCNVGIFDPADPEPMLTRYLPHSIISLVTSPDTSGFLALDDSAQVWILSEGSDPSSIATAQPLQDLQLDKVDTQADVVAAIDDAEDDMVSDAGGEADGDDAVEEQAAVDMDLDAEDDDFSALVVPQQRLAEIFDATPAYAAPSMEDMFYRVTSLLAAKPLSSAP